LNVSLPPDLERLVDQRVRDGDFASASDMVSEGLRLLLARETDRHARLAELDAAIALGEEQAARGELLDAEGSRARVEAALAARGIGLRGA